MSFDKGVVAMAQVRVFEPEVIEVEEKRVSCDGGGGALGHPKVWLEMGERNAVDCPYCDRHFTLKPGAKPKAHH